MKYYLAGPMRGYPQFNFPAFDAAAALLRAEGHEVFSPAEHDRSVYGEDFGKDAVTGNETGALDFSLRGALGADTAYICSTAEAVAFLPNWERSNGALAEWALARALGLQIRYLGDANAVTY